MANYIIRAALAEETNDGWVWICGPSQTLGPRTVVKIRPPTSRRVVYTEVRRMDCNFLKQYNENMGTIDICCERDTIVMAEWYRTALAIRETTNRDNNTGTVPLIVSEARVRVWRSLRAACHHPDPVVRLGTRLGMLGVWLGDLGIWLGLLGVFAMSSMALLFGFGFLGLLGVLGVWAGSAPPRPRLK